MIYIQSVAVEELNQGKLKILGENEEAETEETEAIATEQE